MQPDCNGRTRACFLSWGLSRPVRPTTTLWRAGTDCRGPASLSSERLQQTDGGQKPHGLGYAPVCRARSDFCDLDHILISSAPVCRALRLSIDAGDHHGTQGLTRGLGLPGPAAPVDIAALRWQAASTADSAHGRLQRSLALPYCGTRSGPGCLPLGSLMLGNRLIRVDLRRQHDGAPAACQRTHRGRMSLYSHAALALH